MGEEGLHGLDDVKVDFTELEMSNELVGAGQFGEVSKAILYGTDVCLKRMILSDDPEEDEKYITRELRVLQSIHHPNIMQFMGVCNHDGHTYMVTEYVEGGNVRELLKSPKALAWATRVRMAADVATALAYLHQKHIMHRDLKSNNLLVDQSLRIKVCDFGFARTTKVASIEKGKSRARAMTLCGTDEWMAPEVIMGLPYNEKADVFSYGIVLWEIITRERPDNKNMPRVPGNAYRLDDEIISRLIPKDCPANLRQIFNDCIEYEADDRPDMKEVARRLRMLMKELLDEQELKQRAEEDKKKVAKSITKVELHLGSIGINSVAVFASEDQIMDDFVEKVCETVNNRLKDDEKIKSSDLVVAAPIAGDLVKLDGDINPFIFFAEHVGTEKNFCYHIFNTATFAERVKAGGASGTGARPRRGSFFGRRGSVGSKEDKKNIA